MKLADLQKLQDARRGVLPWHVGRDHSISAVRLPVAITFRMSRTLLSSLDYCFQSANGSEASILVHEVLVAMRADDNGGTIDNIIKTVHIHPALSGVVGSAAADIRRI